MCIYKTISTNIDNVNRVLGQWVAWLALAMVLCMFFNVVSRYVLNVNLVWQQELVRFMHAILFLSTAGYTMLYDKHVRVDVIYQQLSLRVRAIIDLLGVIVFLLPICIVIVYFSYDFIANSWSVWEGSAEYNGMAGIFLLKTSIWVFAINLALQGVSTICKSIITLKE